MSEAQVVLAASDPHGSEYSHRGGIESCPCGCGRPRPASKRARHLRVYATDACRARVRNRRIAALVALGAKFTAQLSLPGLGRGEHAFLTADDDRRFTDSIEPEPTSGCWLWAADAFASGYGRFWVSSQRKSWRAHRVSYERFVGPIPAGLTLDHLCRVKLCVNPAHLEAVTHRVNCLRGISQPAVNARKTHCKNGHLLSPDNSFPSSSKSGTRSCAICGRARAIEQVRRSQCASEMAALSQGLPFGSQLERAFSTWIQGDAGRYVEAEVTRLALEDRRSGRQRGEINLYLALVRRSSRGITKDRDGYACNNSYRAQLARKLMRECQELRDYFEVRPLRGRVA